MKFLLYFIVAIICLFSASKSVHAQVYFNDWVASIDIPFELAGTYSMVYKGAIYVLGGANTSTPIPEVGIYNKIGSDGSLTEWKYLSAPPPVRYWHSGAVYNDYVYLIGGADINWIPINTVIVGKLTDSGDILSWQNITPLPSPLVLSGAAVFENKLYIAGGNPINIDHTGEFTSQDVLVANIDPETGTIGNWTKVGVLPRRMFGFGMLEMNGYIYIFGGKTRDNTNDDIVVDDVYRAKILSNGTFTEWEELVPLSRPIWRVSITKIGNYLITVGGEYAYLPYYRFALKDVSFATLLEDGYISDWKPGPMLLRENCCSPVVSWNNYLYLIGGHDEIHYFKSVFQNSLNFSIPTTKTIFAPGLMASWNTDAILNCNPDTNTGWVLAPYAEDVYNPIIQAITESGWETIPYYYDWRKPVNENSQKLASFLNYETSPSEKVNFVGHSMGGLVGRGYLDISDGDKLESLLTVGTPNTGSAYAYAPWEGGEIWSNSLIEKIALTIYLRHCGDAGQNDMEIVREEVPSIQDLLPTYPYLKRVKSDAPYLPDKDENLNTWLTGLNSDSKGVRLGYVAGTGYETIETIQTKDPNKKDGREGLWEDGKPARRIPTDQGDGTVLASSAVLPENSWSAVINQNHRGLVNSVEGMSKILEFLGTPNESTITTETYTPDSALVLIGYPGLFSVTDKDGKIKQSKEGMVALMNPKSGNYKVNLLPKSENTLFIVAQFLPNGEIKYKEYNLKGLTPKFKTLKFDLQNPSEDILN